MRDASDFNPHGNSSRNNFTGWSPRFQTAAIPLTRHRPHCMDRPSRRVQTTVLRSRKPPPIHNPGLHSELHLQRNRHFRAVPGQNSAQYPIFLQSLLTRRFQNASARSFGVAEPAC